MRDPLAGSLSQQRSHAAFQRNKNLKVLYAELETRHFTFRCAAVTKNNSIDDAAKREIETTLHRGLRWHCEQAGVDPGKLLKYVAAGATTTFTCLNRESSTGTASR